jgi:hypothetical protein
MIFYLIQFNNYLLCYQVHNKSMKYRFYTKVFLVLTASNLQACEDYCSGLLCFPTKQ